MGCCGCADEPSSKVEPTTPENEGISTRHSEHVFVTDRSCTDILILILVIGLAIGYGFLVRNAVEKGDVFRVINGYDNCGNVCGRVTKGETDPEFQCKGKDMTNMRYLLMTMDANGVKSRNCVANCSDQLVFHNARASGLCPLIVGETSRQFVNEKRDQTTGIIVHMSEINGPSRSFMNS